MKARGLHAMAVNIASCHFMLCVVLGGVVLFLSMGYGLSDAYHAPAWWFVVLDKMLQLLEAPVAVVLRLLIIPPPALTRPAFSRLIWWTAQIFSSSLDCVPCGVLGSGIWPRMPFADLKPGSQIEDVDSIFMTDAVLLARARGGRNKPRSSPFQMARLTSNAVS